MGAMAAVMEAVDWAAGGRGAVEMEAGLVVEDSAAAATGADWAVAGLGAADSAVAKAVVGWAEEESLVVMADSVAMVAAATEVEGLEVMD